MAQQALSYVLDSSSPMFTYTAGQSMHNPSGGSSDWQVNTTSVPSTFSVYQFGSSMSLQFFGNAITLHGTAHLTPSITIDNAAEILSQAPANVVYETTALSPAAHTLNATLPDFKPGLFQIPGRSTGGPGPGFPFPPLFSIQFATVSNPYTLDQPPVIANLSANSTFLTYDGGWTPTYNGSMLTTAPGASVSFNFTGVAVAVEGPTGVRSGFGAYSVNLDNTTMDLTASIADVSSTQLFYCGGLDPHQRHSVIISNSNESHDHNFALNSITIWSTAGISNSSNSSSGNPQADRSHNRHSSGPSHDIVAIVVPIVTVFLAMILGVLAWALIRHRRRQRTPSTTPIVEAVTSPTPRSHPSFPSTLHLSDRMAFFASLRETMYRPGNRSAIPSPSPDASSVRSNWSVVPDDTNALYHTGSAENGANQPTREPSSRRPSLGDNLTRILELLTSKREKSVEGAGVCDDLESVSATSSAGVAR